MMHFPFNISAQIVYQHLSIWPQVLHVHTNIAYYLVFLFSIRSFMQYRLLNNRYVFVTGFGKTDQVVIFCISEISFWNTGVAVVLLCCITAMYLLNKYRKFICSYCFIANSAVQYSLLVSEIAFYNHCNITSVTYKGVGGGGNGWASRRRTLPTIRPQTVVLCSQQATATYTNHRIDQDSHWQQSGTQPILISAPQWPQQDL